MFAVVGRGLFHDVAKNRFGTLGRSFFTLFQLITLDDWYEVYSEVIHEKPGWVTFIADSTCLNMVRVKLRSNCNIKLKLHPNVILKFLFLFVVTWKAFIRKLNTCSFKTS